MSLLAGILIVLVTLAAAGVVALIHVRADIAAGSLLQLVVVALLAFAAGWSLDHLLGRDREAEQLATRVSELTSRGLAPGSPLACLDGMVGETVEEACEKALFASAEATAAAVSYVAAQIALVTSASLRRQEIQAGSQLNNLRRAIETDRFGIAAHVLAARGCTPNLCSTFALLQDSTRLKTNLMRRTFDARVEKQMAAWPSGGAPPVPVQPTRLETAVPPGLKESNRELYFPSADSIPAVNIMTAEPASRPPAEAAGEAPAASSAARKPRATAPKQPPSPPPHASEPLPLAPGAQ